MLAGPVAVLALEQDRGVARLSELLRSNPDVFAFSPKSAAGRIVKLGALCAHNATGAGRMLELSFDALFGVHRLADGP
jgi:hypothetical protein